MATSLPRHLNPETGEWEVDPAPEPESTTALPPPTDPLPPPGPAPANTGYYNPNQDFIKGNLTPQQTMPTENTPEQPRVVLNPEETATAQKTLDELYPKDTTTTDTTTPTALPGELSYQMTRDDQQRWIENYLSSHGGDPSKSGYWMGKLALGWDIPYFMSKLENDESIPGAQWSIDAANAARASSLLTPITPPASLAVGGASGVGSDWNQSQYDDSYGNDDIGHAELAPNGDPVGNWNNGENDPFAELGGGVRLADGTWVPKSHALAQGALWQGGTTTGTTTSTKTTTGGPVNRTYQQAIQKLLNTPDKVDPTELMNSSENQAFQLAQQRNEERNRAQIAERNAANGLSASGGQENAFAGLRQTRGEQEAAFVGQLAITRMQQQREDLVNGIQFAMADQQFEEAQALKEKLARLDASIREKQMQLQAATEDAKLRESGRQYDLGLGFNYTELQARQQQAAMELLLNGGSFA